MTKSGARLVIVGDGEFAEIAYEYFTHDSPLSVAAFAVERPYLTKSELFGLPVVPFEEVERHFDPAGHQSFVAITYTQLNRVRTRLYHAAKQKGYTAASYVSSRAFVWRNATIGENCFVFENNVIQYRASIGNNSVLWSGNHVGHRAVVGDHCFISSHVVISGYCEVGESCFLGVNSCIGDRVKLVRDCVIGAGSVIVQNTEPGKVYKGDRDGPSRVSSLTLFKVREAS
ncbi:MAG TPA: acetyltransferase [Gemmataceae bacterium]|jgi:sugar O-acyltransferase (sialic acid O-acetyltransferase NeuD family)|nr:acetyltransferase [Gemmataceae bacterium]